MLARCSRIALLFFVSLWLGACMDAQSVDLLRTPSTQMLIDKDGVFQTPPPEGEAWQKFDRHVLEQMPHDTRTRVWFSFPIAGDQGTHLFLNGCNNIASLYQNRQLIKRDSEQRTYPFMPSLFTSEPIVALAETSLASTLYVQTIYSGRSQFCYDCLQLSLSSRYNAMLVLFESAAPELFATFVTFFLGLLSLFLTISRRQKMVAYFCLFVFTMSSIYFNENLIIKLVLGQSANWDALAYFSVLLAPIFFLFFIEEVVKPPFQIAQRIAWLNIAIFFLELIAFVTIPDFSLALHRRYFFMFLLAELLLIPPLSIVGIIKKRPFAKSFGCGAILVVAAAGHDVWADLFAVSKPLVLMPFALAGFITLLLGIITSLATQEDAAIEKEKLKLAQERTHKLMNDAARRTSDLARHSDQLARLNHELSDKHEFLIAQAQKVSEHAEEKDRLLQQIHLIRESSLPKILAKLQHLHKAPDPLLIQSIDEEASKIRQVFEVLARLYAMRQHMVDRRLLIFDAEKKNQRFYKLALGGSKMELTLVGSHEEFSEQLSEHTFELIGIHEQQAAALALTRSKQPESSIIIFHEAPLLQSLAENPSLVHYLPLYLPRPLLQKILLTHVTKLLTREIFGLERYLSWGSMVKEISVTQQDQRSDVIKVMKVDLENQSMAPEVLGKLNSAALHLLDLQASGLLASASPLASIPKLESQTLLRYGYDSSFLMVSVSLHGKLSADIQQLFQGSEAVASIADLLRIADCLILNTDHEVRHELLVIIQSDQQGERSERASFHIFTLDRDRSQFLQSA